MNKLSLNQLRQAAWAGILGPALFVAVFLIEGWLRPGYSPLSEYVSALSMGPRGWIQIANFLMVGLALFVFTRAVAQVFTSGKASRGGVTLLTITAVCFFLSGPFVMDPTGTPLDQATVHGTIHGILGAIAFMLMPICMFVYLHRFNADPDWASLRGWTLGLGILSALGLIALTIFSKLPQFQSTFEPWFGLVQRTLIIPFMVWVSLFAAAVRRHLETRVG